MRDVSVIEIDFGAIPQSKPVDSQMNAFQGPVSFILHSADKWIQQFAQRWRSIYLMGQRIYQGAQQ